MRITTLVFGLVLLAPPAWAAESSSTDEQALKAAQIGSDGPSLLAYLRQQTLAAGSRDKIQALIKQLGDDSFEVREKATADLVALGPMALPLLRQALKDPDLEVVRRAEHCLQRIDRHPGASLAGAAARLIKAKKPDGAVAVLLDYLPTAESDVVADEVRAALAAVALRAGKPDAALTAALTDKVPLKRAAAAEALCRAGAVDQRAKIVPLLNDPEPIVRLRVALALAPLKEKEAIAVLIALLDQLPIESLLPAEDLLLQLAGEHAPTVSLSGDKAARQKCREAWTSWWREHGAKVDLARLTEAPPVLGYTLVVLLDKGQILELDRDNKPRFQIEGLDFPLDAQLLPGDRVLVAEQQGGRVTERNSKGEVVWEKKVDAPLMAQRLPNGHTFIATRTQLLEVDRAGKEVFTYVPPDGEGIMRAQKLRTGDMAYVSTGQQFHRLDAAGKEVGKFPVQVQTSGGRIDVLANGHILIPQMRDNKVVEYDPQGKAVWEATVEQPIAAVRLPNGNTLITSMTQKRAVEVNRVGKEIWEFKSDTRVTRAFRR